MTIETVKGRYTTITYSRDTYHIIHSEIELGDCLFAKFDEASNIHYLQIISDLGSRREKIQSV